MLIMSMLAAMLGLSPRVTAQRFVSINIAPTHCVGDSMSISVGYNYWNNVVVENPQRSISHPQSTFLPDGVICDSAVGNCTFRSPITFTAFQSTTLTSAQDIDFVRLNIEHSWVADILIALECPNGQFASLINANHAPSPADICGDPKFDNLVGWIGPNIGGVNLGETSRFGDNPDDLCDSASNPPGVGWNYCWSQNSRHQYASEDGLLYRMANVRDDDFGQSVIDSTDIAADTQFYHPQQSFDSLIGCPLNGTWNIVVQDNWGNDNGYIFDWQLAFDSSLYTPPFISFMSMRWGNEMWSSTSPGLSVYDIPIAPQMSDTTIEYSIKVVFSTGDTIDTVFTVHWAENYYETVTDTLCMGDTARWNNLVFTTDTLHVIRDTTFFGCDSMVTLSYTFMPSYNLHDTLPFCANEAYIYDGIDYGGPATIVISNLTQYGCDSTVTVHLVTIDSLFHLQMQMSDDGDIWTTDTVLHGCRPFTVHLRDTTIFERWRRWDFGDGDTLYQTINAYQQPQPVTHTYDTVGAFTLMLTAESIHGCVDSAVIRKKAVRVYDTPEADFSWSPALVVNHDPWTQLLNQSSPRDSVTIRWQIPNGEDRIDTTTEENPLCHWPVGCGDIGVVLTAVWTHVINDTLTLECIDTAMRTVVITNEYLQFPNMVTPNGDGVNDRWEVVNLLECGLYTMNELWIYNHWGVLVYHVSNISSPEDFWDPTSCPDGTYYFRFSAKNLFGVVRRNGTIEVVR